MEFGGLRVKCLGVYGEVRGFMVGFESLWWGLGVYGGV